MTFFRFDIGSRAKAIGRFVGHVRDEYLRAVTEEKNSTGLHRDTLAQRLGMSRSLLEGQLSGRKAFTLRGLADLAHALDREIVFELRRPREGTGQNIRPTTSTMDTHQVFQFGQSAKSSSTTTIDPPGKNIQQSSYRGASIE